LRTVRIAISGRFFYDIIPTETGLVPFDKYGDWRLGIGVLGIGYLVLVIWYWVRNAGRDARPCASTAGNTNNTKMSDCMKNS